MAEMMAGGVVSALSRREGICPSVLHRWLRRARAEGGRAGTPMRSPVPSMLPVRLALPPAAGPSRSVAALEVVLGNGRVLRIPPGADPALVARMAAALE